MTARFGFNSLYLLHASMQVLDPYIVHVCPLLQPLCDYVLVTQIGQQHTKNGQLMSKMVFEATGKFIHPTQYHQIVETTSDQQLTSNKQESITEDQKHSSIAKVHYQKRQSRNVATKAHECLKKLHGTKGSQLEGEVSSRLSSGNSPISSPDKEDQSNGPSVDCDTPVNCGKWKEKNATIYPRRKQKTIEGYQMTWIWSGSSNSSRSKIQVSKWTNCKLFIKSHNVQIERMKQKMEKKEKKEKEKKETKY